MDGSENRLKLKCRLVPHGNRDKDKDFIRKDSTTAQFPVIRALLSAAAILGLNLGTIDISGAYLQAGQLNREVFVRLPRSWSNSPFTVWRLLVPAYGLVESGRLWQMTVEHWMEQVYGTETVLGFVQLFVVRKAKRIVLIIAKVVDDFLIAGDPQDIQHFHNQISKRFKVGRFICGKDLVFNRLKIHREKGGSITIDMNEYSSKIHSLDIDPRRRKEFNSKCTREEHHAFLALAGQLNWLGHGVLPQACYISSLLQQWTADLRVQHLIDANKALHELRKLEPLLIYRRDEDNSNFLKESTLMAFTDASQGKTSYGQTGYIAGLHNARTNVFHLVDWHSSKQGRVSYSSVGAEILAAAESTGRASLLQFGLHDLYGDVTSFPLVLNTDSDGIFSTITTLHEGKDYRLRPTVSRLRDSFESQEISVMQWIPGKHNPADALTQLFHVQIIESHCIYWNNIASPIQGSSSKAFKLLTLEISYITILLLLELTTLALHRL